MYSFKGLSFLLLCFCFCFFLLNMKMSFLLWNYSYTKWEIVHCIYFMFFAWSACISFQTYVGNSTDLGNRIQWKLLCSGHAGGMRSLRSTAAWTRLQSLNMKEGNPWMICTQFGDLSHLPQVCVFGSHFISTVPVWFDSLRAKLNLSRTKKK